MTKLSRAARVKLTNRIEDTLALYCRSCEFHTTETKKGNCHVCPVSVELQRLGTELNQHPGFKTEPQAPKNGAYTPEEDALIWHLRSKGVTYRRISAELGRYRDSVYKRAIRIGEVKSKG